jgi:hypothetical protein
MTGVAKLRSPFAARRIRDQACPPVVSVEGECRDCKARVWIATTDLPTIDVRELRVFCDPCMAERLKKKR